jgi:hypothetical protein
MQSLFDRVLLILATVGRKGRIRVFSKTRDQSNMGETKRLILERRMEHSFAEHDVFPYGGSCGSPEYPNMRLSDSLTVNVCTRPRA